MFLLSTTGAGGAAPVVSEATSFGKPPDGDVKLLSAAMIGDDAEGTEEMIGVPLEAVTRNWLAGTVQWYLGACHSNNGVPASRTGGI
jgi:hypothetical protein